VLRTISKTYLILHSIRMAPFRIAVLECDTPIDAIRERHGTYGNLIKRLMQSSLLASTAVKVEAPTFTSWDVVAKEYPQFDDVDALFLSGSSKDALGSTRTTSKLQIATDTSQSTTRSTTRTGFSHWSGLCARSTRQHRNWWSASASATRS
jgi:hypothetical protein